MLKSIEFEGYKCFNHGVIKTDKKINIIFGRNNIGKSSLLDVVEQFYSNNLDKITKLYANYELNATTIESASKYTGVLDNDYKKNIENEVFTFEIDKIRSRFNFIVDDSFYQNNNKANDQYCNFWRTFQNLELISKRPIKRIYAERDIRPESESSSMATKGNGEGITTIISNYLNKSQYDESIVRVELLNKLNEIMGDDAVFEEIISQQVEFNEETKWELFLKEKGKSRVALSQSGSGLKTILMVLVYTIILPKSENKNLDDYLFLFEELENNLHPALQRRMLKYIKSLDIECFITTHSNIFLDSFSPDDNVNLTHVVKVDGDVNIIGINNFSQVTKMLDDLGLKASDMLQSNGIIWVEGPSDRLYINHWIKLWSDGKYVEGIDYQCIPYGGKLLSHYAYSEPFINIIKTNRNSIIVIDSDKKQTDDDINETKKRIIEEASTVGTDFWLTHGREIENYVDGALIRKIYDNQTISYGEFEEIEDVLKTADIDGRFRKVEFAKKVIENSELSDFKEKLDLNEKMTFIIQKIESWSR